jgi:hypothetical protein
VRGWFLRSGVTGVAIIFGPVSAGIYSRDFDKEAAYRLWSAKNATLAASLPTVKTARGYHVYFRSTLELSTKKYPDGELRGKGAYCLAPPSKHPSGVFYKWLTPLTTDNLLTVEHPYTVFGTDTESTEGKERIESTEGIEETERIEEVDDNRRGVSVCGCVLDDLEINEIVQLALPSEKSRNHDYLFLLARAVKTQERKQGKLCSEDLLGKIFDAWYAKNRQNLRAESPKCDYFFEFLDAYKYAIYPLGEGVFEGAIGRAKESEPPRIALELYDEPQMQRLVAVCRELQRESGDHPFFLAYGTVAKVFNLPSPTVAGRRMKDLVRRKVIAEVEKPTPIKATRYRYLHPLEDGENPAAASSQPRPIQDTPDVSMSDMDSDASADIL